MSKVVHQKRREDWELSSRMGAGHVEVRSHALHDSSVGDVVELPVVESYRTLNIKALSMLSWAHRRYPNLQWLVRHDDDVYLRAPALLAQLASRPPIRYLWGMFDHGSSPVRDPAHQHYNSYEQFPKSHDSIKAWRPLLWLERTLRILLFWKTSYKHSTRTPFGPRTVLCLSNNH